MTTSPHLVCVGVGMMLGAHLTPRARSAIEDADIVLSAVSDPLVELWLRELNPHLEGLQHLYAAGKPRQQTYAEMVRALLEPLRAGQRVCGAFYGHPGVFAQAPHRAIAQAREQGFTAWMEPGISAADCLFADLGIDPGSHGCQHYEASQFLLYRTPLNTAAHLVLWQVGIAGDLSCTRLQSQPDAGALLQQRLREHYRDSQPLILYEAATLPLATPRCERITLAALAQVPLQLQTTLVVPPSTAACPDVEWRARLRAGRADSETAS